MTKTKICGFLAIFLIANVACNTLAQDSKGSFRIKMSEMVNGVHPDFPWFSYTYCPGFVEDEYLELIDYTFEEVPTAGKGQWVTWTFFSKTSVFIDSASMTVTWSGIPFFSGSGDIKEYYEAGTTFTRREYAYLKIAPAGNYKINANVFNEMGSEIVCVNANIYVRPAKN